MNIKIVSQKAEKRTRSKIEIELDAVKIARALAETPWPQRQEFFTAIARALSTPHREGAIAVAFEGLSRTWA